MSVAFELYDDPRKGCGMKAIRDIRAGEIVCREKPMIVVPEKIFNGDVRDLDDYVTKKLNRLSSAERETFYDLADSRSPAGEKTTLGIFFTNDMTFIDDAAAVFSIISRSNHSCHPNADFITKEDLGVQDLVATEDIPEGAEITLSYFPSQGEGSDIRSTRRKYLRYWYQFHCLCRICTLEGKELIDNEKVRIQIKILQSAMKSKHQLTEEQLHGIIDDVQLIRGVKLPYHLKILEESWESALGQNDVALASKFIIRGLLTSTIVNDLLAMEKWETRRQSTMISIGGRLHLFPVAA